MTRFDILYFGILALLLCAYAVSRGIAEARQFQEPRTPDRYQTPEIPPVPEAPTLPPGFVPLRKAKKPKVKYAAIRQMHLHDQEEAEAHHG